ncbi:MAG: hypothetical protein H0W72_13435 [Planctomycetes bacterium]|nr:hypothetical protein [Planctomycetota bacterium]
MDNPYAAPASPESALQPDIAALRTIAIPMKKELVELRLGAEAVQVKRSTTQRTFARERLFDEAVFVFGRTKKLLLKKDAVLGPVDEADFAAALRYFGVAAFIARDAKQSRTLLLITGLCLVGFGFMVFSTGQGDRLQVILDGAFIGLGFLQIAYYFASARMTTHRVYLCALVLNAWFLLTMAGYGAREGSWWCGIVAVIAFFAAKAAWTKYRYFGSLAADGGAGPDAEKVAEAAV